MKKITVLLIMIASPLIGQENNKNTQMNFPYVNNSLKLYTALGTPTGIGLLYAPEIRSSINNNVLHVLNFDLKWLGMDIVSTQMMFNGWGFDFQYSVGTLLASGGRLYFDLIGIGYTVATIPHIKINILGIQYTLANGFYMGLRTHINLELYQFTASSQVSFGGYAVLGYDFGKKINPKDYESKI